MHRKEKIKSQETAPGSREATEFLHLIAHVQRLQKMLFLRTCPWPDRYPSLHQSCQDTNIYLCKIWSSKAWCSLGDGRFQTYKMHKKLPLSLCSITLCLSVHRLHSIRIDCDRRGGAGHHCALPLQCPGQKKHHIHVLGSGQLPQLKVFPAHYLDKWLDGDRAAQQQVPAARGPAEGGRVPDHRGRQGSGLWDLLLPCGDPRVVQWSTE